ncbi:MAG: RNA polymerase sigma factor [Deltaproteobacteria bacterium]|nr:RNA polymerase sigma factor [Deltaproteobacteria bacterium]
MDSKDDTEQKPQTESREISGSVSHGMKSHTNLECGELLVRYRNGESHAFVEILSRYRAPVYSYLVRCGVTHMSRDDVFQEIFVRIHAGCAGYDEARPLPPWIFTIVINTVRSYFRKELTVKRAQEERAAQDELDTVHHHDGSHYALAKETGAWLETQLASLPLEQREAVNLVCLNNIEQAQAAAMLDIPLNTLKTNLRRARLKLTEALQRRNLIIERESAR